MTTGTMTAIQFKFAFIFLMGLISVETAFGIVVDIDEAMSARCIRGPSGVSKLATSRSSSRGKAKPNSSTIEWSTPRKVLMPGISSSLPLTVWDKGPLAGEAPITEFKLYLSKKEMKQIVADQMGAQFVDDADFVDRVMEQTVIKFSDAGDVYSFSNRAGFGIYRRESVDKRTVSKLLLFQTQRFFNHELVALSADGRYFVYGLRSSPQKLTLIDLEKVLVSGQESDAQYRPIYLSTEFRNSRPTSDGGIIRMQTLTGIEFIDAKELYVTDVLHGGHLFLP